MKNAAALGQARKLLSESNRSLVELGRLLAQVKDSAGHGGFQTFCRKVPIGARRAYYLIEVANAVGRRCLAERDVTQLGWSKALVIGQQNLPSKRRGAVVEYARAHSVKQLVAHLKPDGAPDVTRSFQLSKSDAGVLDQVLEMFGARRSKHRMDGRNEALMAMSRRFQKKVIKLAA